MTRYRRDLRRRWTAVIPGLLFLAAGAAGGDAGRAPDPAAATRTLAGRVVDTAGEPVAGASISLWDHALQRMPYKDREAFEAPQTATGPDGRFSFDAVAPGLYDLVAVPAAHPPGLLLGVEVEPGSAPVEVAPLRLPPGIDAVGQVVDAAGEPVAGISVTVRSWASFPPYLPHGNRPLRETVTDDRGRYRLPGLPIDTELWLRYEAKGWVAVAETIRLPGAAKPASGRPAAASEPARHRLAPVNLAAAARIELTVVDGGGLPLEGARVDHHDLSVPVVGGGVVELAESDADGRVRLEGLAGGRWRVNAWRPGYHEAEAPVELTAGESASVRLVLERADATELEVRLLRPDGAPACGAEVRLDTLRAELQYGGAFQTTGDDGRVRFADVPVGIYQVIAEHPDYPRLRLDDVAIDHGTPPIEARFEELPWARAEVVGQVTDEDGAAVAGAVVRLEREGDDPLSIETTCGADGRFVIERVREGSYRAEADHPDFAVTRRAAALEVTSPGPVEVGLVLRRGVIVSGELVGVDAGDLHRLRVGAQQAGGLYRGGWVDSTGRYHLEPLGPGAWTITASRPQGASARADITVEGPGQEIDLPLVFPRGVTVSGTVLYKGRPLAGAGVGLNRDLGDGPLGGSWYAAAGADGRFEIRGVVAGRLRLWVSHPEWGRVHQQRLELEADAEIVLDLGAAMASGRVVSEADGLPMAGATLQIGPLDALWVTSHSMPSWADLDADGRFTIGPLEEGRWRLNASAPGHVPKEKVIEVRHGVDVDGVDIALTPTPGLDLILESAAGGAADEVTVRLVDAAGNEVAREVLHPYGEARINWEQAPQGAWRLMASNDLGARVEVPRVTVPGDPVRIVMPADGRVIVRVAAFAPGEAGAQLELLDAAGSLAAAQCRGGCETIRWPINDAGYFVAWGVAPGSYTARVTAADGRTWEGEVELAPASTASLTLE